MASTLEPLGARLVADLGPVFEGFAGRVVTGIGPNGAIYAAARRAADEPVGKRGRRASSGRAARGRAAGQATDTLVACWEREHVRTLVLAGETITASYVQPFAGGVLLADARCAWRGAGADRNAVALDWSGRELGRFTLGDGIADLRVTPAGVIWAAYFDEGVFGNHGWSHPGPPAIGASGLVAFSSSGEVCFTYDAAAARTDSICDAYAMNLAGEDDVWLYFYTEFAIVRIRRGAYRVWRPGVRGARALAVRGHRVLLLGDYERPGLGRVIELRNDGTAKVTGEHLLVDEHGDPLDRAVVWGVGSELYFAMDRRVLVLDCWW